VDSLAEVAFGPLEMRPSEFWVATPAEIKAMSDGWRWRTERNRERDAWMLANLIQPWTKKRLRPSTFLKTNAEEDKRMKLRRMLDEAKQRAEG